MKLFKYLVLPILALALGYFIWNKYLKKSTPQQLEKVDSKDSIAQKNKVEKIELKQNLSKTFTNKLDSALNIYDSLNYYLVEADLANAKKASTQFKNALTAVNFKELNVNDAAIQSAAKDQINNIKNTLSGMQSSNNITAFRKQYNEMNQALYPLLKGILKYSGKKRYWVNCGMPFDEDPDASADWIDTKGEGEFNNPYLGTNHPKYKGTMLHCGTVNDSLGN